MNRGHFVSLPGGHAEWVPESNPTGRPPLTTGDQKRDRRNEYFRVYMAKRRAAKRKLSTEIVQTERKRS